MAEFKDRSHVEGPAVTNRPRFPQGTSPHGLAQDIEHKKEEYDSGRLYQFVGRDAQGNVAGPAAQDGLGQPLPDPSMKYPSRAYAPDPYDTTEALKLAAPPAMGTKMLTADDLNWMRRKQDQMTAMQFKQFVASMYNENDPAQKALLYKVFPELLSERLSIVNQRFELIKQLTKIRIMGGPQSSDDLKLLFALSSGAVSLPSGNMWDPSSWSGMASSPQDALNRGLFSVVKVRQAGQTDATKIPFDQLGSVMVPFGTPSQPMSNAASLTAISNGFNGAI